MVKRDILKKLIDELYAGEELSIAKIKEIASCSSRTSAYTYITTIKEQGYKLMEYKEGREVKWKLESTSNNQYDILNNDDFYDYFILDYLSYKHKSISDLIRILEDDSDGDLIFPYNIKATKFRERILALEDEGFLSHTGLSPKLYYFSNPNYEINFEKDMGFLTDYRNELMSFPKGHPHYKEYQSVANKINILMGNPDDIVSDNSDHYISYGKNYIGAERISHFINKLNGIDYTTKILKITFNDKKGKEHTLTIKVGLVMYAPDTDQLYLIYQKSNLRKFAPEIINENTITGYTEINSIPVKEQIYGSSKYINLYSKMFAPETGSDIKVRVRFKNFADIRQKISALANQRKKYATIEADENSDYFIYTDTIIGLNAFAGYLRKFGNNCEALEPQALRKQMKNSCEKALKEYEEI